VQTESPIDAGDALIHLRDEPVLEHMSVRIGAKRMQLIKQVVQAVLVAAALLLLGRYVYFRWREVSQIALSFLVAPLLISLVLLLGFYFGYSQSWQRLLEWIGAGSASLDRLALYRVFFVSFVSRYLPAGSLLQLSGRVELLKREGGRRKLGAQSLYYEQLYLIGGAGILAWLAIVARPLPWVPSWLGGLGLPSMGLGLLLLVTLLTAPDALLRFARRTLPSISKRMASAVLPPLRLTQRIELLARFILVNLAQGLAAFFVLWSIYPQVNTVPGIFLTTAAAYVSGRVAGQLAPLVPGGIGVREGAFTVLLGSLVPVQPLIVCAAIFRFISVVMEIALLGTLSGLERLRSGPGGPASDAT
jgi:uncharacterized membrane protein YbhN (UPF0104 family)